MMDEREGYDWCARHKIYHQCNGANMDTSKATPRPWHTESDTVVWRLDGYFVADTHNHPSAVGTLAEYENAALIVQAVNSFEAMRQTLQKVLDMSNGATVEFGEDGPLWKDIVAALALAEGKE